MKRIWILGLILVVALASLGAAYGMWFVTLNITGTVTTGTLSAVIVPGTVSLPQTKDIATCTATAVAGTTGGPVDTLEISFTEAYPGVTCTVPFTVMNTGTIPIHLELPTLVTTAPPEEIMIGVGPCFAEDEQVHAGASSPECKIAMTVQQNPAAMGKTFTFTASFIAHQYNEEETSPMR